MVSDHITGGVMDSDCKAQAHRHCLYITAHYTCLHLEADFALLHAVSASSSSPHERKAGKGHRRHLVARLVNGQTQVAVICRFHTTFQTAQKLSFALRKPNTYKES